MYFGFNSSKKAGTSGFAEETHSLLDQLYVEPKLSAHHVYEDLEDDYNDYKLEANELLGDCVMAI